MSTGRAEWKGEVLGIDGCPGGWLIVGRDASGYSLEVLNAEEQLKQRVSNAVLSLIDIPIGLPAAHGPRRCDAILRQRLGSQYANSVFSVPVRKAVYAQSYEQACRINQELTGKRISLQLWNIAPRIRQVDSILLQAPFLRESVKECHPEWLMRLLHQNKPIPAKKSSRGGLELRKELLRSQGIPVERLQGRLYENYYKKQAKPDDLLDALVLNHAAWRIAFEGKKLHSLPAEPDTDEQGLPMAIFYAEP